MFDVTNIMHMEEYSKLLVGLLAMLNPIAAVQVILGFRVRYQLRELQYMAVIAVGVSALVLSLFAFYGDVLLSAFGITVPAFMVAGGVVVLLAALKMLNSQTETEIADKVSPRKSLAGTAVVPLAVPLLSGPAAITTVLVYSRIHHTVEHSVTVGAVIVVSHFIVLVFLFFAPAIHRVVGDTGVDIATRLMGVLVAAIAVEFILDGVALHFPELFGFDGH